MIDDLWAELAGEDWDESEDGDSGEIIGDGERQRGTIHL
jgi:hypothetical protein